MTDEEFSAAYLMHGQNGDCNGLQSNSNALEELEWNHRRLPREWDWRDHNGVSPVKDQGHCGSCWAFSATGTMESHIMIKYGEYRDLSEQQLIDCSGSNYGCNGGWPSRAMRYIMNTGGITDEWHYPYRARTGHVCKYEAVEKTAELHAGPRFIEPGDEDELKAAIYVHGPVSVAFDVTSDFRHYHCGVYRSWWCSSSPWALNHAVVAVGYGVEGGVPYWLVKNSWGTSWGDHGYFKIERGNNMCGIANCNSYPYGTWITPHRPPCEE